MIIFNYNTLLKEYDPQIRYYAQKLKFSDTDDSIQDIRLYIYSNIDRFDMHQSSLKYYVRMLIITAYHKLIYDRRRQEVFEGSFSSIVIDSPHAEVDDRSEIIIKRLFKKTNNLTRLSILVAIVYNKDNKNFTEISKFLGIKYGTFLNHVQKIREMTKEVLIELERETKWAEKNFQKITNQNQ